jgi:D-glycero-alpha-D-manno-heptose-7-phosphate kinase
MIITRTPFRISFFGGGTDYPAYYREHGGSVISTTINKYCYVTCRYLPPFFDYAYRIRYSRKEETNHVEEIEHPSVRECLKFVGIRNGVEMVHASDIPAMSGIGSSSAFTVGFLLALQSLKGVLVTKRRLAYDAIHVEQNLIGENVGSQDQTAAAFGGFNKIEFGSAEGIFVQPVTMREELLKYLQSCLLFYFTGFSRSASEVAAEQIRQTPNRLRELSQMRQMVDVALEILSGPAESFNDFGKLLHESWLLKRSLTNKISNGQIDEIYETGIRAGALGGKICGAGGGGFILFFAPPENQPRIKEALQKLLLVPFRFEYLGAHVIHYSDSGW